MLRSEFAIGRADSNAPGNSFATQLPAPARPLWKGEVWQHDKLRVAYLSADFHRHAVAVAIANLFELHDCSRYEILGNGPDDRNDTAPA